MVSFVDMEQLFLSSSWRKSPKFSPCLVSLKYNAQSSYLGSLTHSASSAYSLCIYQCAFGYK